MELIFIPAIIFFEVILIHLFEVVEVVRAFRIDTFVEDEVLPLFLWDEGVAAVWAAQLHGSDMLSVWGVESTPKERSGIK